MRNETRRLFLCQSAALVGSAMAGFPSVARGGAAPLVGKLLGDESETTFLAAVRRGDAVRVRQLLEDHPRLSTAVDPTGRSALVIACLERHVDVIAILTKARKEIDLVEAVMIPDWERAEQIALASPERLEDWHPVGGTPLYAAARAGQTGYWRLQVWGAQPDGNPRGRFGVTPAYGALECKQPVDAMRSTVSLLSNGAHVNAPQRGGDTLLHKAVRRGDEYLVRYLLRRGANVYARNDRGESALDQAIQREHAAVIAILEKPWQVPRDDFSMRYAYDANGERISWPDLSDVSPERQGAVTGPSHGDLETVRKLVEPDPRLSFSRSSQNELTIEASAHIGSRQVARFHLDRGVPQSVATSLSIGDLARARALLEENPSSIHERGPHDFALFWYAAIGGGSVEAAELLIEFGADVDQESTRTTALHWAASRDQLDLARFLIEEGADIDAVGYKFDPAGQTPLQLAHARKREKMVKLLRDLGAS